LTQRLVAAKMDLCCGGGFPEPGVPRALCCPREAIIRLTKLLYTSDLHGSQAHYLRLLTAAESLKPDLVVLGGDLLPDDSANDPQTLGHGQPQYVRTQFRENVANLRECCGCKDILVIFGNHDWASSIPAMEELARDGLVTILSHTRQVRVNGLSFLGYSCTPPTPWYVKDFERLDKPGDRAPLLGGACWSARFSRPVHHGAELLFEEVRTIQEDLTAVKAPKDPWIFVIHAPPLGTFLDRAYGNKSYGSQAIREVLETHQPLMSLHGHIHESPTVSGNWRDVLGKTVAINPGQNSRSLAYAVAEIDVAAGKIISVENGQQA
jgi:Icc-related predicted phosphoesterase